MANEVIKENNVKTVIMQSAKLFAENGVENTTFIMIGKAAGVTGRSVQNYFQSKDDLVFQVLSAVLRSDIDKFNKRVNSEAYKNLSGLEQYLDILKYIVVEAKVRYQYIASSLEMESILLRGGRGLPARLYSIKRNEDIRHMRLAIEKGVDDGTIKKDLIENPSIARTMVFTARGLRRQIALSCFSQDISQRENIDSVIIDYLNMARYTAVAERVNENKNTENKEK